jgi:hypothetical protein
MSKTTKITNVMAAEANTISRMKKGDGSDD